MSDRLTVMTSRLAAFLLLVIGTLGAAALVPSPCQACSCAVQTPAQALAAADAVFTGEVVRSEAPTGGSSAALMRYDVRVTRVFKGTVPAEVEVFSPVSGSSCGRELTEDAWVFYARWGAGETLFGTPVGGLLVTLCDGTDLARNVDLDAVLGQGRAPDPSLSGALPASPDATSGPTSATGPTSYAGYVIGGVASLIGFGALAQFAVSRQRRRAEPH